MRLFVLTVGVLMTAGRVFAQEMLVDRPSIVGGDKSTILQWLITVAFLVGGLFLAFKPAKRSKMG